MSAIVTTAQTAAKHRNVSDLLPADWQVARKPDRFRIATAGIKCPRALYFRMDGEGELPDWKTSRFAERAIDIALDDPGTLAHEPVYIQRGELHLHGTADLLVHHGNDPCLVVRFHVVDGKEWDRAADKELEEHRAEANLLAYGAGAPRWSVCYVHEDSGEMREFVGEVNPLAVEWAFDHFESVAEYRGRRTAPRCPNQKYVRAGECCQCRWSKVDA